MDVAGMINARQGVLYLWQSTSMETPLASVIVGGALSSAGALASVGEIDLHLPDVTANIALGTWDAARNARSGNAAGIAAGGAAQIQTKASNLNPTLWSQIKEWAQGFVEKIWGKLKDVFGDLAEVLGLIKNLGTFVAGQVFSTVQSTIGGVTNLVQGLWKMTYGVVERVDVWLAKKAVKLVFGHPTTLAKGIEQGLNRAMLEGIYQTIKGAVSTGLNAAGYGAGVIVDAVVTVVETVVKILWRIAEYFIVKGFVEKAKVFWHTRNEATSIVNNSQKFDDWLRPTVTRVPLIAAVTMGSGIAGDKMRFLQMLAGDGSAISQDQFDSGVAYLDKVKRSGARLIERSDCKFTSDDPVVQGLLKLAASHTETHDATSTGRKVLRIFDRVLRA